MVRVKRKMKKLIKKVIVSLFVATVVLLGICITLSYCVKEDNIFRVFKTTEKVEKPEIEKKFLTPNKYSRPKIALEEVKGIVVHYTGNPGSTAIGNRNYFENLRIKKTTYASSHFVVGLDGEIIQCLPLDEISYASNDRNSDTISIECCHEDKSGKFNDKTFESLVELVAWLCGEYNLTKKDIIRHYDVTGKQCPKYYVKNEEEWKNFKTEVFEYIDEKKITGSTEASSESEKE